jgi:hypothetical protein
MPLSRHADVPAVGANALAAGVAAVALLMLLLTLLFGFAAVSVGGPPGLGQVCRLDGRQAGEGPARYPYLRGRH